MTRLAFKIKFKKLNPNAVIPTRAKPGDAGADLVAISKEWDEVNQVLTFDTGIAVQIPIGSVGLLVPRSSVYKTGLTLCNTCGILDEGYRGSIQFKFYPGDRPKKNYEIGDRIGQLVIVPYINYPFIEVEELDETERGSGGFGSTNT